MAKKKKKISPLVKAKRRYRRNKGGRLDMRKGGRGSKQFGGINIPNLDKFNKEPGETEADYRNRLGITTDEDTTTEDTTTEDTTTEDTTTEDTTTEDTTTEDTTTETGWWTDLGYASKEDAMAATHADGFSLYNEDGSLKERTENFWTVSKDGNWEYENDPSGTLTGNRKPTSEYLAEQKKAGYDWDTEANNWIPITEEARDAAVYQESEASRVARAERIGETGELIDKAARGEVPEKGVIPDAQKVGYQRDSEGNLILDADGDPIELKEAATKQIEDSTLFDAAATAAKTTDQEIAQAGATTAAAVPTTTPAVSQTGTERVSTTVTFDPATGALSAGALAQATEATLTKAAEGVTIDDDKVIASLQERVVGTIDPESKATIVKVAGLNLPRVLRAKKQLRKAGLDEATISEIGNDIDALEARLMDLTEAERGMIEGLPEEALVSTQLDGLLKGIEEGEVPTWARPAVAAVNEMMARRGLDASTVGRDNLFNAIIQSAVPLAQSNAQAIKESVMQQRGIEAQAEIQNAQMAQQTALNSADKVFNLNMAQFTADQNQKISDSKFFQSVTMTEASNAQQAIMQEAVSMAQLDLANLDANTKLAAQNAQAFLQMDMANLTNEQQGKVLKSQQEQQRMLSNQAAENASKQFNASSINQRNQFMANLSTQVSLNNASRADAMTQFNTQQTNAANAANANRAADVSKFNAQMETSIDQFNAQQDFQRVQWNTQNAQVVEQANTQWRRQANTINTAAQNAINQQNAQNAFALSSQSQSFLWQELRDQADYDFKAVENELQRKASLAIAALGNDSLVYKGRNVSSALNSALNAIKNYSYGAASTTRAPDYDDEDRTPGGG